jgi:hypothetical protein
MAINDFTPSDMRLLLDVIERVCIFLNMNNGNEYAPLRARITSLVVECAEGGERDPQKLFDCAREGLAKVNGQ